MTIERLVKKKLSISYGKWSFFFISKFFHAKLFLNQLKPKKCCFKSNFNIILHLSVVEDILKKLNYDLLTIKYKRYPEQLKHIQFQTKILIRRIFVKVKLIKNLAEFTIQVIIHTHTHTHTHTHIYIYIYIYIHTFRVVFSSRQYLVTAEVQHYASVDPFNKRTSLTAYFSCLFPLLYCGTNQENAKALGFCCMNLSNSNGCWSDSKLLQSFGCNSNLY